MWRLFIFLVLVMFNAEARLSDNEITFTIESKKNENNLLHLTCDHNDESKQVNKYTVLEGEEFKIITNYNRFINHFSCRDYNNDTGLFNHESQSNTRNVTTFIAKKNMGTLWNCTVLSNRNTVLQSVIQYKNGTYTATYCYMQIHVRQKKPPQKILVNNMALQAARTDLSKKDIDFTAEYQYADGDVVNVDCGNFLGTASLTIEYPMADSLSDKFKSTDLSSSRAIRFSTKLHSGHNNSYMICTDTERTDYTKVMVRFVMRTEFNIVRIKINGKTLRPTLYNMQNALYIIKYKYKSNIPIKVVCEVERADMVLVVTDSLRGYVGGVHGYEKTEPIPSKQSVMSFQLNGDNKTLSCGSDYRKGGSAEIVNIRFSEGKFPIEPYQLQMALPPNGTVMELFAYSDEKPLNVIFYEFEDGERLQLKCGPLRLTGEGPIVYLQFKDSKCNDGGCYVTQNLIVTEKHDNSEIVCGLMEMKDVEPSKEDRVVKEIRVILRRRALTTSTNTTTTPAPERIFIAMFLSARL